MARHFTTRHPTVSITHTIPIAILCISYLLGSTRARSFAVRNPIESINIISSRTVQRLSVATQPDMQWYRVLSLGKAAEAWS